MTDPDTSTPRAGIAGWDPAAGFRETFLLRLSDRGEIAILRQLTAVLYRRKMGKARLPASSAALRADLGAAVADLRHLQGFLANAAAGVAESRPDSERRLAILAQELAESLDRIAAFAEETLQ